jgi:PPOX class probable F420-dependent enzyme
LSEPFFNERQKAFLAYPHYGVVSTINADGAPQTTVIWFIREGDDLIFTTDAESLKAKNMRRDPRISLLVNHGGRYVSLRGTVELDEDAQHGSEWLLRIAQRYYGEEEGANQFNSMNQKPQVVVRFKPAKILAVGL